MKNKSGQPVASKLSLLPRVLSGGAAEAAVAAGLAVGKVGQRVWADQVSEERTQSQQRRQSVRREPAHAGARGSYLRMSVGGVAV